MDLEKREASFEKLWEEEISPALADLSDEKKKAIKYNTGIFGVVVTGFLSFFFFGNLDSLNFDNLLVPAIVFCLLALFFLFFISLIKKNKNNYSKNFREKIFNVIVKNTKFGWSFESFNDGLPSLTKEKQEVYIDRFEKSCLYSSYEKVSVDEVITSKHQNAKIAASEVLATYTVRTKDGNREVTVFKGFFVEINLNNPFVGETYVMTEADGGYFIGSYKMNVSSSEIKETELEWNDFEKFLEVRTNNPIEAREIFTPDFMGVIYDWWIVHKKNLRFAFKEKSMFIAIPSNVNFEATFTRSKEKEKKIIKEHLDFLWFIEEITEMLLYYNKNKLN